MRFSEINQSLLLELYQEGEDDFFQDGGDHYSINKIFKFTEKTLVFDVSINDLVWQINDDDELTEEDEERIEKADCSVPVIVWKKKKKLILVDGMHRLLKAMRDGLETLPAKYILDAFMAKSKTN